MVVRLLSEMSKLKWSLGKRRHRNTAKEPVGRAIDRNQQRDPVFQNTWFGNRNEKLVLLPQSLLLSTKNKIQNKRGSQLCYFAYS